MKQKLLFCLLFLFCLQKAIALTIYISPKGDDNNPGTIKKPLASLAGARDMIRKLKKDGKLNESVRVVVGEGVYTITEPVVFNSEDSGSKLYPVSYEAARSGNAIFRGGIKLPSFTKTDNGLYWLKLSGAHPASIEQLFINGRRTPLSRYPDTGYFKPKAVKETVIKVPGNDNADSALLQIKLEKTQVNYFNSLSEADFQQAVVTFHHNWDFTRKKILKYVAADSAFYVMGNKMKPWNPINTQTTVCIENTKKDLHTPGTWCSDQNGEIWYSPSKKETPNNSNNVFTPVAKQLLVIRGLADKKVSYLTFSGLNFEMTKFELPANGIEPVQAAATS